MDHVKLLGLETNILGDVNCNVTACLLEPHTKNFFEICNLYQFHQLINIHTRITKKSATTIDLFITNNKEMYMHSGVCHIGISDHSLVYAVWKLCIPKGKPKIVEARQFRNFDTGSFCADLCLVPWHLVKLEDNPNSAWEIWSCLFLEICYSHAPKQKRKIRNNFAPWLTPELKGLMFERDELKRAAISNKLEAYWAEYMTARKNVKAKVNYYKKYFETNLGDMKKSWRRNKQNRCW